VEEARARTKIFATAERYQAQIWTQDQSLLPFPEVIKKTRDRKRKHQLDDITPVRSADSRALLRLLTPHRDGQRGG